MKTAFKKVEFTTRRNVEAISCCELSLKTMDQQSTTSQCKNLNADQK